MAIKTITLTGTGPQPTVDVFIGQAQYGEYTVTVKTTAGERIIQAEGDNADDIADTFPLKTPLAELNQCYLSWWITVRAPTAGGGQFYFARVAVKQGEDIVGEPFEYSGPLADTKNIIDVIQLVVV